MAADLATCFNPERNNEKPIQLESAKKEKGILNFLRKKKKQFFILLNKYKNFVLINFDIILHIMKYKEEVFAILKSKTNKSFDLESNIRDLGLDSLDLVEMMVEFQEKYNIEIPTEKMNQIKTIKDILDAINQNLTSLKL